MLYKRLDTSNNTDANTKKHQPKYYPTESHAPEALSKVHTTRMLGERRSLLTLPVTRLTSLTEHPNRELAGPTIH